MTSTAHAHFTAFSRVWGAACRRQRQTPQQIEARLQSAYRQMVDHVAPQVVVEIGAHEATFSRWAAEHLGSSRVVAFEANPYVHEKYAAALAGTRVDYRHQAVAPTTGPVTLHLPRHVRSRDVGRAGPMASLTNHLHASDTETVEVPGVRLDEAVPLADHERAVLWVDVEGATEAVLTSAPAVLARTDLVLVEVEREETWAGQWLDRDVAAHLATFDLFPLARDITHRRKQYNLVLARTHLLEDPFIARQAARVLVPQRGEQG